MTPNLNIATRIEIEINVAHLFSFQGKTTSIGDTISCFERFDSTSSPLKTFNSGLWFGNMWADVDTWDHSSGGDTVTSISQNQLSSPKS